ncbi:MAG: SdpI family protein [Candidatus Zixiibacteriota bacterium]
MRTLETHWQTELPMWLVLAAMFALALVTWSWAPERIPMHWNLQGHIDRYGGKLEGLLAIPLLAIGIYLLMLLLPRIDPGRANYPLFSGAYLVIRTAMVVFLALIYGVIHLWIRGHEVAVQTVVPILVGGFFIVIGNLLGKIRPNWFLGVRTPWTLSSKTSWSKSNRLAGWLLITSGLLTAAVGILQPTWGIWLIIVSLAALVLIVTPYSYFVWRHDPERVPPAGSSPAEER